MLNTVNFRIKDCDTKSQEDIHDKLKTIAMVLMTKTIYSKTKFIAHEGQSHDLMQITSHSQIYESNHGYKYQLGSSNDWKMSPIDEELNIFTLSYRYGQPEKMQKIGHGICQLLDLDYIYDMNLETTIIEEIHPIIKSKISDSNNDEVFERSRFLIDGALNALRVREKDLQDEKIHDAILDIMKTML